MSNISNRSNSELHRIMQSVWTLMLEEMRANNVTFNEAGFFIFSLTCWATAAIGAECPAVEADIKRLMLHFSEGVDKVKTLLPK